MAPAHLFIDGNKRIGALLFLEYLRRHELLHLESGVPRLDANAVVALTLLIAESDPRQKSLMIRLVLAMLDDRPAPTDVRSQNSGAQKRGDWIAAPAS